MQSECFDLMNRADAVYLATVGADGRPNIRAMLNLRREDLYPGAGRFCRQGQGFIVYFGTTLSSSKVREIRANPNVAVCFCDPKKFLGLTLAGRAEVLTGPELRRQLWEDEWRVFYPLGPEDPEWVVLRLKPETAQGWNGTDHFEFDPR